MFDNLDKLRLEFLAIFIVLLLSVLWHLITHKTTAIKGVYAEKKDDSEKNLDEYISSAHSGIIRGAISGIILGDLGITSALHQGAVSGVLNPLMLYFGH